MSGTYITTRGLVLREAKYKESSKMLTVLTETEGKLSVAARGVLRKGSKTAPAAQLLAYSELTLSEGKDVWTLTEARPLELFLGLRDDISHLALGSYFAELLEMVSDEDIPDPELLSLGLNALYALSTKRYPQEQIKAAFEFRLMRCAGFAPISDACPSCGKAQEDPVLCPVEGAVLCAGCAPAGSEKLPLSSGAFAAMRYILEASPKKVFSFRLERDALRMLAHAAERYLIVQTDREPATLRFYRQVKEI